MAGKTVALTVTVNDGNPNDTYTTTVNVTVQAATTTPPTFMPFIPDIKTTMGTPVNVTLPSYDPGGTPSFAYDGGTPTDGSVYMSSFSASGTMTITPAAGFAGLSAVFVGMSTPNENSSTDSYDVQTVPVWVTPNAPTLKLLSPSLSGETAVNKSLEFQVDGLFATSSENFVVTLYEDGVAVGTATATGSSVDITTPSTTIADGTHVFTGHPELPDERHRRGRHQSG